MNEIADMTHTNMHTPPWKIEIESEILIGVLQDTRTEVRSRWYRT